MSLYQAILDNNYNLFQELAQKSNIDINQIRGSGYTLLHDAIRHNRVDMVKLLLESNVNINAINDIGYTPLIVAVINSNNFIMEMLLQHGADVNCQCLFEGRTALHIACIHENQAQIKMLLNWNADPFIKTKRKETAFELCSKDTRVFIQLHYMWEMNELEYSNFIQWLPRELLEDLIDLIKSSEYNPCVYKAFKYRFS